MTSGTTGLSDDVYYRFRELISNHCGLYFPEQKRRDLEIGLSKALGSTSKEITDVDTYYHFLSAVSDPEAQAEMTRLMSLLTIGETHFFRNEAQFDALQNHILPNLIRQKRMMATTSGSNAPATLRLRLWSAGCATGEEPYSLAILLRELIPDIVNWHILILATDINEAFLSRARQALYSAWSFRESRAVAMRSHYFTQKGKQYQLRDDIRQMVTFTYHNLGANNFPAFSNNTSGMDVIICRNVMIYFGSETTHALVNRFYDALVDGGWLVVGHSEPSMLMYRRFQVHSFPNTLLYQKTGQPTFRFDNWQGEGVWNQEQPLEPVMEPSTAVFLKIEEENTTTLSAGCQSGILVSLPPVEASLPLADNGSETAKGVDAAGTIQPLPDQAILRFEETKDEYTEHQCAYAYTQLANAYADKENWNQARHWCELALELDSLLPEAYFTLAMVDEHEGKIEGAITNLKKAIYLDQKQPLSHFNLAMLYLKEGQKAQAQRALHNSRKILAQWPPERIIPYSGGSSAQRLLSVVQNILAEFESE